MLAFFFLLLLRTAKQRKKRTTRKLSIRRIWLLEYAGDRRSCAKLWAARTVCHSMWSKEIIIYVLLCWLLNGDFVFFFFNFSRSPSYLGTDFSFRFSASWANFSLSWRLRGQLHWECVWVPLGRREWYRGHDNGLRIIPKFIKLFIHLYIVWPIRWRYADRWLTQKCHFIALNLRWLRARQYQAVFVCMVYTPFRRLIYSHFLTSFGTFVKFFENENCFERKLRVRDCGAASFSVTFESTDTYGVSVWFSSPKYKRYSLWKKMIEKVFVRMGLRICISREMRDLRGAWPMPHLVDKNRAYYTIQGL